jgi:phosphatidylglycerol:prolipoprotein diacylglycerol transferase
MLDFIIWDVNPELFSIGRLAPRWYGPLFALGFFVGQYILTRIYKTEGRPVKEVETLTIYMVLATIIGARLGHCLFYEPDYFLSHPIEILFIWQGGLASHGAAIAILIALWMYCSKNPGQSFLYVLDRMVITVALAACFIRLGNLTNSEIIGIPANVPQGFVFVNSTTNYIKETFKGQITDISVKENGTDSTFNGKYLTGVDIRMKVKSIGNGNILEMAQQNIRQTIYASPEYGEHILLSKAKESVFVGAEGRDGTEVIIKAWGIPRHPAQLYESLSSLLLFFILLFVYSRFKAKTPEGLLFGIFMIWIFTLRFFYEFIKENQVTFENDMTLNMGQILSIPMVLIGIIVLVRSLMLKKS